MLLSSLRLDLEMAQRGYRRYAAYPAATLAGVFTNIVFGFLRVYVLLALFAQRDVIGGYDASAAVTYAWLTQALIMVVFVWGWQDLALRIRTGDIATDLTRPVHPLRAGLAFDFGRAVYHGVFRGVPPFLAGALFFPLTLPGSAAVWLAFAASLALAVVVSFAFRWLTNATAFWLLDYRGVMIMSATAVTLLSGFLLPIALFPDWLAAIARATPFPAMVQIPVDIFVGRITGLDLVGAVGAQLAWALALLAFARGAFALGVRRLVVQGG